MSERINRIVDDQIIFIMTQTQKFQSVLIINTDSFICQSAGIVREKFFTDFNKNAVRLDHINFFDFFIMAQISCHTAVPAAAGAKPRQSKSRFSSLGRKDRSTSTAAKMPMVSHCMESGR